MVLYSCHLVPITYKVDLDALVSLLSLLGKPCTVSSLRIDYYYADSQYSIL